MKELELKYGCNPNQKPSRIYMNDDRELPIKVLSGRPGYINFLDAFNGWQLVSELKKATGLPAATSFKHVSPAFSLFHSSNFLSLLFLDCDPTIIKSLCQILLDQNICPTFRKNLFYQIRPLDQ